MLYKVVGVFEILEVKLCCLKILVSSIHGIMSLCRMLDSRGGGLYGKSFIISLLHRCPKTNMNSHIGIELFRLVSFTKTIVI